MKGMKTRLLSSAFIKFL